MDRPATNINRKIVWEHVAREVYFAAKNGASLRFLSSLLQTQTFEPVYLLACLGARLLATGDFPLVKRGRPSSADSNKVKQVVPQALLTDMSVMGISIQTYSKFYSISTDELIGRFDENSIQELLKEDFPHLFSGYSCRHYEFSVVSSRLSTPFRSGRIYKIISGHFAEIQVYGPEPRKLYRVATRLHHLMCHCLRLQAFNLPHPGLTDRRQTAMDWTPKRQDTSSLVTYVPEDTLVDFILALAAGHLTQKFRHPEINRFANNYVIGQRLEEERLILEILLYLDVHGNCPSVLNIFSNPTSQDNRNYKMLGGITLLAHSVRVAEILLRKNGNFARGASIVTALCHDIGKIIGHKHPHIYETSLHPVWSSDILFKMTFIDDCPHHDSVSNAIRNHHNRITSGSLTTIKDRLVIKLQESDTEAREIECQDFRAKSKEMA
jgi:hypothetical protein